jgi:hypothetical protein
MPERENFQPSPRREICPAKDVSTTSSPLGEAPER